MKTRNQILGCILATVCWIGIAHAQDASSIDANGANAARDRGRVTLHFRDSPIQEVFEALSHKDKVNIILGRGVTGEVSVNLYDMTVDEAVHRIAETAGYAVETRADGYVVRDRKDVGLDHPGDFLQLQTFKVQYSDPAQVADILSKYVSRHGRVTALSARHMLVVEDQPEYVERAGRLLAQLDVQPRQILIEAKVLELELTDGETYGIDWSRVFSTAAGRQSSLGTSSLASGSTTGGPQLPGLFFSLANSNLNVFLEAQATRNRVHTLSSPRLLAMENEEAKVVVGNSTGYQVTTTINQVTTQSIQFLESGVILKVTPSVDRQGRVLLKVHPEVSSMTLNAGIPDKKSTEVTTEFLCEDGQSVFIGGLLKRENTASKTSVPLLGDLPIVGRLFSASNELLSHTETVIIITPTVVRDFASERAGDDSEIRHVEDAARWLATQGGRSEAPENGPVHPEATSPQERQFTAP